MQHHNNVNLRLDHPFLKMCPKCDNINFSIWDVYVKPHLSGILEIRFYIKCECGINYYALHVRQDCIVDEISTPTRTIEEQVITEFERHNRKNTAQD